jgi:alkylated DNA repair dioxygenase AlkB
MTKQLDLIPTGPEWPQGFEYRGDFLSVAEERDLAQRLASLPFRPFEFQGYLGNRRVVSFGWQYVFDGSGLKKTEDMPDFLLPLRDRAAEFAAFEPDQLQHVLLTEYAPGAGIGWHKDRSVFGDTIGISLLAPCRFRFRKKEDGKWKRASILAEPRSAYLLRGASRTEWEHSIPPLEALRYSITFRNLL